MRKRLLCVLVAAVLLLGTLVGCGGGPSGSSQPDKPEVGSTKPDKGGNMDDPVAVMNERVKAVNDAVNYECVGLEETVEKGLLFYRLIGSSSDGPHDYNPDKPLDYSVGYEMYIGHAEGIVNKDTFVALLKNERYTGEVAASDVIETDDLYVYFDPDTTHGSASYRHWCYILVKNTDIVYLFTVGEGWNKADYYDYDRASDLQKLSYTEDDAEYIFTAEFWRAFAQTAKFVGNADEDFEKGKCIDCTIRSSYGREGYIPISSYDESRYDILDVDEDEMEVRVKIPYIEEWYAEPIKPDAPADDPDDPDAIYDGFEEFLENRDEEYGFLVIDDFGQGKPTMFFNNGLYKYAGCGEVTLIHDFSDISDGWEFICTDADKTRLLFAIEHPDNAEFKIVDLKSFEIEIYVKYDRNEDDSLEFSSGTINGVPADEETVTVLVADSNCDIFLLGRDGDNELDLDAAWREYESRG